MPKESKPVDIASLSDEDLLAKLAEARKSYDAVLPKAKEGELADRKTALAELEALAATVAEVKAEQAVRTEAEAEVQNKLTELETAFAEPVAEEEIEAEPVVEEEKKEEEEEAEALVIAEPEVAPVPAPAIAEAPKAMAAATPVIKATPVSQIKVSAQAKPVKTAVSPITITAAAGVPGMSPGGRIENIEELSKAMLSRHEAFAHSRMSGPPGDESIPVATIHAPFPEDRTLTSDPQHNDAVLKRHLAPEALVASGGLCAPLEGYYKLVSNESLDRPWRDALPNFKAARGGIRFIPDAALSEFGGGIGRTTVAQDVSGANYPKPCLSFVCKPEQTVQVEAQHVCLTFSNWNERFYPEMIENFTRKTMVQGARISETAIADKVNACSLQVTSPEAYGAGRTMLSVIDQAAANMRSSKRLGARYMLRTVFPFWVHELIRADLTRSQEDGNFCITDEQIDACFRVRHIAPSFVLEGPTGLGQVFGAQGAGPLRDFPDVVVWFMWEEGSYLYLNGGTLDVGVVRSNTENRVNTFATFEEEFDNVACVGPQGWKIQTSICANGTAAPGGTLVTCAPGS
ncbi:MAG: major capsid protein [Actinomycetota bacterium]